MNNLRNILLAALATCSGVALAKVTELNSSGNWQTASWSAGVPGPDDKAIIKGAATVVNADGVDVHVATNLISTATDDNVVYMQTQGSYTSGQLTEIGNGGTSTAVMQLQDADVELKGYRFVIGRNAGLARFAMAGGTLNQNLSDGLLLGVSQRSGSSTLCLSNVTWNISGGKMKIGHASTTKTVVDVTGGALTSSVQFQFGANVAGMTANAHGETEMYLRDGSWTQTAQIYAPLEADRYSAYLHLTNATLNLAEVNLAHGNNSTGIVEIIDSTVAMASGKTINLARGTNSRARLLLRNVADPAAVMSAVRFNNMAASAVAEIELDHSPWNPSANWSLSAYGGFVDYAIRNQSMTAAGDITVGSTGNGRLELDHAEVTLASGKSLYVADGETTTKGEFVMKGGSLTLQGTGSLVVPRKGIAKAEISGDAQLSVYDLYVPNMTGSSGELLLKDNAYLGVTRRFYLGNQSSSTGRVVQAGGEIFVIGESAACSMSPADGVISTYVMNGGIFTDVSGGNFNMAYGNNAEATLELNGGTFAVGTLNTAAKTGNRATIKFNGGTLQMVKEPTINFISDKIVALVGAGGAIIDSNGYDNYYTTVAASLLHDPDGPAKDGGLTKLGEGTLKIYGSPTFTGDVVVEAGTLDMRDATFTLGAEARIGGAGRLRPPLSGLTVTGGFKLDPELTGLQMDGTLTLGATATVELASGAELASGNEYTLVTANTIVGTVQSGASLPVGWQAAVVDNAIVVREVQPPRGTVIYLK